MKLSDVLRISFKNLTANKMRTLLTVLGISVGIATIVFLVSLGFGLQELSVRKIGSISSITALDVMPAKSDVTLNESSITDFSKISNVEKVSPLLSLTGKLSLDKSSTDVVTNAVDINYFSYQGIKIASGNLPSSNSNDIVISAATAKALNMNSDTIIGKEINIIVYYPVANADPGKFEVKSKVTGVVDDSASSYIYFPLDKVKTFMGQTATYNSTKVKVTTQENIKDVKKTIEEKGYKVTSIADTIGQINQFFKIIQIVLASFGVIALIVASIGMFNTMTIALLERTRDIGIMKAVGVQNNAVWKMFLTESFLISFFGGVVGVILGVAFGYLINFLVNFLAASVGPYQPEKFFSTPPLVILVILAFSLVVGIATGFYPAKRASGLNPLDALRYE